MAGQELHYLSKEQQFIEDIKSIIGNKFLGDDCARIYGSFLVGSDSLVEGTHFLLQTATFTDIGWKAMASVLSDFAAMAGHPRYALVDLCLPNNLSQKNFHDLYSSL